MLASISRRQLCGQGAGSVLAESRAYSGNFVGQNCVIFGERVSDNDRVKHAQPAGEQKSRGQRKEQNELECDGALFIRHSRPRAPPRPRTLSRPVLLE
jgi:hypothetical protein